MSRNDLAFVHNFINFRNCKMPHFSYYLSCSACHTAGELSDTVAANNQLQCDFRFDLFFQFQFQFPVIFQFYFRFSFHHFFILVLVLPVIIQFQFHSSFIKPADEDVLMICLNTVHRQSLIQRRTAVAPISTVLYASTFLE